MTTRSKLTKLEKSYIAGLFDGEGSVSINKFRTKNPKYKCPSYVLSLTVTNTNKEVIEWLYTKMDGSKHIRKRVWGKSHWKTCYSWMASANKALVVLKAIYPYMRIKKPQAKLAIEFQSLKSTKRKFVYSGKLKGHTLSPETIAEREQVYIQMRKYNGTI